MKNDFKLNRKIIATHLKMHWKLIFYFTITYLFLAVIGIFLSFQMTFPGTNKPFIGSATIKVTDGTGGVQGIGGFSIHNSMDITIFGGIGLLLFSIFIILMINASFNNEIKSNKIALWMTLPLSRFQIIFSKIFFLVIVCIIIFIPSFLVTTIVAFTAYDAEKFKWSFVLWGIKFLIFIIFISILFYSISIAFFDKSTLLTLGILSIIAGYMFFMWALQWNFGSYSEKGSLVWNLRYLSLQQLIANPLEFGNEVEDIVIIEKNNTIITYTLKEHIQQSTIWQVCSIFIIEVMSIIFMLFSNIFWKNKDLNI